MPKIEINASDVRRLKLHMEAAWNFVTARGSPKEQTYKFAKFGVFVFRACDGAIITREVPARWR